MYITKSFVKEIKIHKSVIYILLNKDGLGPRATIDWLQKYIIIYFKKLI